MASKKRGTPQYRKKVRHSLAKLKDLGLYRGNAKKNPTRYAERLVRTMEPVLAGRAAVVTVPKRKTAQEFKEKFTVRYNKIVVPKVDKDERVRFDPRSGNITSTRRSYGVKVRTIRTKKVINSPDDLPEGPNIRYAVPFAGGRYRQRFGDKRGLLDFMTPYETSARPYRDWWRYVEIEVIDPNEAGEDLDDEDEAA